MSASPLKVNSVFQSWIDRIFKPLRDMRIEDDILILTHHNNTEETFQLSDFEDFAKCRKSFFAYEVTLNISNQSRVFKWLKSEQSKRFVDLINGDIGQTITSDTQRKIRVFLDQVYNCFPRDSWGTNLEFILGSLYRRHSNFIKVLDANLSSAEQKVLRKIIDFFPFDLERIRKEHEQYQLKKRSSFFDRVESNPLTDEQRLAVLRNNDRNMVLAAAGTGKTSVIVAKALDLMDRGVAVPSRILILAYNNSAAKEVRQRLVHRAETSGIALETKPDIFTFHALGRKILRDVGNSTCLPSAPMEQFRAIA